MAEPPDGTVDRPAAESFFSAQEIARSRTYHRPRYRYAVAGGALGLAYLAALAFSPAGEWLAGPVDDLPRWAFALGYAALVLAAGAALRLPLSLWRHRYERRWGFSTQSLGGFLADRAKGLAVGAVLAGGILVAFVEAAAALPRAWPLSAAPAGVALVVVLTYLAPVVLEPVFNRFRPLRDEALAGDLRALADRAGVPVRRVLVADASRRTTKHNAYVSGLSGTRRVVLFDTLLSGVSPREVRLVVAHELGHQRARHVARGTALAAAAMVAGVVVLWLLLRSGAVLSAIGASGAGDPRVVPFVFLVASGLELLGLPAFNAVSRRWEAEADRAGWELTDDAEGFAWMSRNLAVANLSDLAPGRLAYLLLFTHPSPPERIAAALAARGEAPVSRGT